MSGDTLDVLDGTVAGVGFCRSCHREVALVRRVWCPLCGSSLGLHPVEDDE